MKSLKSQNYYEILGVGREASPEEIRKAYEISTQTFQKNSLATYSLFTDEENQEILALISRAFETLHDPDLRAEYDTFLESLGPSEALPAQRRSAVRLSAEQEPERPVGTTPNAEQSEPILHAAEQQEPDTTRKGADPAEEFLRSVDVLDGKALKKIRQMRGVSIDEIAERTKIRKTYIEYIEEDNFDFLPAAVYVKGFITMIAGLLQLPQQQVAESYMQHYRRVREPEVNAL